MKCSDETKLRTDASYPPHEESRQLALLLLLVSLWLLPVLVINALFTLGIPGISIGGHLGGFLAGGAAGWILLDYGSRRDVEKWVPFALCGVLAVGCLVTGVVFATAWTPT